MAADSLQARNWWKGVGDEFDCWDDLRFPASAINPVGQTNAASVDTVEADYPATLLFSNSTDQMCAGVAQMPHEWLLDSDIKPHIHWMKTSDATGNVVWEFKYRIIGSVGGSAGAWSSADNGTLAVSHNNLKATHALTAFTAIPMTGCRESAMVAWMLYRRTGGSDTYAAPARLLELDFHFQRQAGKRGTIDEYPQIG